MPDRPTMTADTAERIALAVIESLRVSGCGEHLERIEMEGRDAYEHIVECCADQVRRVIGEERMLPAARHSMRECLERALEETDWVHDLIQPKIRIAMESRGANGIQRTDLWRALEIACGEGEDDG